MVECVDCGAENAPEASFCVGCGSQSGLGGPVSNEDNTDNFWDVGGYKPILKRINNGAKLCDELTKMLSDRAKIEKEYAKALTKWAETWEERIVKINEYGTLKQGWRSLLTEARAISSLHNQVREDLEEGLETEIETWKKNNYPKSFLHYKSYKRSAAAFSKAQAPWTKRKEKVMKLKKTIAQHQQQAQNYQQQGLEQQVHKEEAASKKAKQKLQQRIEEMIQYSDIYTREMRLEFARCQEEEGKRILFFKSILQKYHKKTDIADKLRGPHEILESASDVVNADSDLNRYAAEFGADMPVLYPDDHGNFHPGLPTTRASTFSTSSSSTYKQPEPAAAPAAPVSHGGGETKMRALYDYQSTKPDELTFAFDDLITVLPGEADVGWLRGRLDGKEGIFPANYVEVDT